MTSQAGKSEMAHSPKFRYTPPTSANSGKLFKPYYRALHQACETMKRCATYTDGLRRGFRASEQAGDAHDFSFAARQIAHDEVPASTSDLLVAFRYSLLNDAQIEILNLEADDQEQEQREAFREARVDPIVRRLRLPEFRD